MRILLPLYGMLLVVFAAGVLFVFKMGLDAYVASNGLAAAMKPAPAGWVMRPYDPDDGRQITQIGLEPDGHEGTTAEILARYDIPSLGLSDGVVATFERGDQMVAMRITRQPHLPVRISLMERLGRELAAQKEQIDPNAVFATVAGLPLIEQPRVSVAKDDPILVPVNYRYFTMTVGDQTVDEIYDISVLTNSSDAAIANVLNSLDVALLNSRLPTADPLVMASAGVLTRDALPLSDEPPRATPAFRAKLLLDEGQVFDAPWQAALVQIRNGDITDWDGLQARYPRIDTLPFALLEVLDDGSHENTARYFAAILSNSGRDWTGHEFHVLSTIAEVGTTQMDLTEYLAGDFPVAPEVLSLINRLPVAPDPARVETQVVQSQTLPVAGLTGAASCVIDNGVRRCVVGGD